MVRANHLDSPPSYNDDFPSRLHDNGCTNQNSVATGRHHRHTSSSASSTASTNPVADWGSLSLSSASSVTSTGSSGFSSSHVHGLNGDFGEKLKWSSSSDKNDLIHLNLSSSSEDYGDEERIKLLCGDPDTAEEWPEDGKGVASASVCRRRRIFPKLTKILYKVRRKLNWQLMLFLAVILVVFLSMSQLNEYQYRSVGIAGWDLNTTRDAAVYLLPDRHTALLEPRVMDRDKRYLLLVIVCSALQNFETRQTIRQTWANGSEFNYERHFARMHRYAAEESYAAVDRMEMQRIGRQLFGGDHLTMTDGSTTIRDASQIDSHRVSSTQVIFLVGKSQSNATTQQQLLEESNAFGDVIQEDFIDTYNNLTLKSLMLLKWIVHFNDDADRVKYVMKCDDDTFLNIPNLVHVLLGGTVPIYTDTFKLYTAATVKRSGWLEGDRELMGFLFRNARPIRDIASKWYAPKYMYRRKIFPNYLSGTGYVIEATRAAKDLYRAAMRTPIFHLEDVYVTGLCASRSANTKPHHNPLFSFLKYANKKCALRGMITQHPLTATDIRKAYERLTNASDGGQCEQPSWESVEALRSAKSKGARNGGRGWVGQKVITTAVVMVWVMGGSLEKWVG